MTLCLYLQCPCVLIAFRSSAVWRELVYCRLCSSSQAIPHHHHCKPLHEIRQVWAVPTPVSLHGDGIQLGCFQSHWLSSRVDSDWMGQVFHITIYCYRRVSTAQAVHVHLNLLETLSHVNYSCDHHEIIIELWWCCYILAWKNYRKLAISLMQCFSRVFLYIAQCVHRNQPNRNHSSSAQSWGYYRPWFSHKSALFQIVHDSKTDNCYHYKAPQSKPYVMKNMDQGKKSLVCFILPRFIYPSMIPHKIMISISATTHHTSTSTRKIQKPYIPTEVSHIKLLHLRQLLDIHVCIWMYRTCSIALDSSSGSGYCSYAGVLLRQYMYRACAGTSSEWKYRCHCIT